jgi:small-conductance mechanosensitive channel
MAVFDRFGNSGLNFTLFCWSFVDKFFVIRSELTIAINNAFKEAGIQIPFPQQDVHVHWRAEDGAAGEPVEASTNVAESQTAQGPMLVAGKASLAKK